MKETIRTASVLEIYDRSIKELEQRKKEVLKQLLGLEVFSRANSYGHKFIQIILGFFSVAAFLLGMTIFGNSNNKQETIVIGVIMILGSVGFGWALIKYSKKEKYDDRENEISELQMKIRGISDEIAEKQLRKKALLQAEEVIISKDLKVMQGSVETETFSNQTIESESEKVCPMCAETVKKAAKICRYCSNKFE